MNYRNFISHPTVSNEAQSKAKCLGQLGITTPFLELLSDASEEEIVRIKSNTKIILSALDNDDLQNCLYLIFVHLCSDSYIVYSNNEAFDHQKTTFL